MRRREGCAAARLGQRARVRGGMALRGLAWRLGHVRRRARERGARALLRLIARVPRLRRLPRPLIAAVERCLLVAADDPCFDRTHYLACNPDVQEAGLDPLAHYLANGWVEGRNPNPRFDDAAYRRQARLGPRDRVSALAHWLALGRARGLGPRQGTRQWTRQGTRGGARGGGARQAGAVVEPADDAAAAAEALARLHAQAPRASGPAEVDVIVPVYRGRAETLRCLASVLEAEGRTRFALVVIDDCGPDARLRADLAGLARRGLIELTVQPRNRGFVAAINRGMALHPARDVVWLNADTEVYGDWIDRLRRAATAGDDVATVTPLTSNGTICSYPHFDVDNVAPLEVGWDEIDRIAARVNAGRAVETPTCVGFATYVRRAAIARIGPLDEAAFGRGYGEENDFSQRAIRAGLRNLIAGDVFVRHLGQTSFGDARRDKVDAALKVVERRHPGYLRTVQRYLAADPVAPLRRAIDLGRLARAAAPGRAVALVSHSRGGGTGQHVAEEADRLARAGRGVVLVSGGTGGPDTVRLGHPQLAELPALAALPLEGPELVAALEALGVVEAQLHHLADFGARGAVRLARLMDCLSLPFDFVAHDYLAVCPRINMADTSGFYCGEPGERGCRRCLARRRSDFGAPDIRRWRRDHGRLLARAREVRVPDGDVAARLRRYFPHLANIAVRPHEPPPAPGPRPAPRRPGPVRIATIGAIGPIKGFDVLLALATEIRARGLEADLAVIGYTRNDAAARAAGIRVTGPYRNEEAATQIARADPDLVLIPSTWPETYCYTLSHALASGRPVAAFDIGALGTRLDAAQARGAAATLLPLALARDPGGLLDALIDALPAELREAPAAREQAPQGTTLGATQGPQRGAPSRAAGGPTGAERDEGCLAPLAGQ